MPITQPFSKKHLEPMNTYITPNYLSIILKNERKMEKKKSRNQEKQTKIPSQQALSVQPTENMKRRSMKEDQMEGQQLEARQIS
jgi:hypothetical protein